MSLDLTKPVKFRGFDYEIWQVIDMGEYLLVLYVDPVIGRQHIQVSRSGNFTGRDTPTRSTYMHTWDLVNVPEPPKTRWIVMMKRDGDTDFFMRESFDAITAITQNMGRLGWMLISRRRVEMTEGVFDE